VAVATTTVAAVVVVTAALAAVTMGTAVTGYNKDNHNNQFKVVAAMAMVMDGNDNNEYTTIN
jgi:hypothetical protein